MTALPPNSALLVAAVRYMNDPKKYERELLYASLKEVEGLLHQQLRDAVKRALRAPATDLPLVIASLNELVVAIGAEAKARRAEKFSDAPPTDLPGQKPPRAAALMIHRPSRLVEPPVVRMPYADD